MLLSEFVSTVSSVYLHPHGMLSLSFDCLLPFRNNSLVFWTETHYDPRIPCQWGTVFGLRVQQEVDDEPVGSMLKCPDVPGFKADV